MRASPNWAASIATSTVMWIGVHVYGSRWSKLVKPAARWAGPTAIGPRATGLEWTGGGLLAHRCRLHARREWPGEQTPADGEEPATSGASSGGFRLSRTSVEDGRDAITGTRVFHLLSAPQAKAMLTRGAGSGARLSREGRPGERARGLAILPACLTIPGVGRRCPHPSVTIAAEAMRPPRRPERQHCMAYNEWACHIVARGGSDLACGGGGPSPVLAFRDAVGHSYRRWPFPTIHPSSRAGRRSWVRHVLPLVPQWLHAPETTETCEQRDPKHFLKGAVSLL